MATDNLAGEYDSIKAWNERGLFAVGKLDPLAEFKLVVNEISEPGRQVFTLNEMWPRWKTHPSLKGRRAAVTLSP